MWLNTLPDSALQVTADGVVVVLREEDQRALLLHFARNRMELFSEIVCPCCKENK